MIRHLLSVGLLFSLFILSACTAATQEMKIGEYKGLQMKIGEDQSFLLGDHDILVHYVQAEPTHVVEVKVDGTVKMVVIEEYKTCPEEDKSIRKKIYDNQGNYVDTENVIEQGLCYYEWQQGEVDFMTFFDYPDDLLRLSVSLPNKEESIVSRLFG